MVTLNEGDKVPAFKATDQHGETISSALLKGKPYVLYFYPKDDTPTCTEQACNLRDNITELRSAGLTIIGISPDDADSHKKFSKKFSLPFSIIPDPKHILIDKFGVWGEKQLYGKTYMGLRRTTFLVDAKGIIQKIFLKPHSKQHSEEIMKAINGFEK